MDAAKTEQFLRLLSAGEREVYRYVFALLPRPHNAQDVMQETVVALWRKFDDYDAARPFVPWACRFAYLEVVQFYKKTRRHPTAQLSLETLAALDTDYFSELAELNARKHALGHCIEKLPESARALINERYYAGKSVQDIARSAQSSPHTLYKQFDQIRVWLLDCVQRNARGRGAL